MKRSDIAILTTAVALVAGLSGFGIGRWTATKPQVTAAGLNSAAGRQGFGGGTRRGGRPTIGTVTSVSGDALVVTDSAGTVHNVTLSAATTYTSGDGTTPATAASLTPGTSVAAFGTAAADGTIPATCIIINPAFPGGGAQSPAANSQLN